MGLESATFVNDLVTTNPLSTDFKSQGDDHLRLIKSVLKNTFTNADKVFQFPTTVAKSANYTVLSTDNNKTIVYDTSGGSCTLTLPTLVLADAGWCIYVLKTTTDANPIYIEPPSGTINGFTKVRRSVAHSLFKVLWTGSVFSAQRQFAVPIGSTIDFYGSALPQGTLWPDGTTFTAADYVELNSALSGNSKPDIRGRNGVGRDDMGGSTAGRITLAGSGITGTTLGATGGEETHTLTEAELPAHDHGGTTGSAGSHSHQLVADTSSDIPLGTNPTQQIAEVSSGGGYALASTATAATLGESDTAASHQHTVASDGGGGAHNNVQPTIICNKVLVAE